MITLNTVNKSLEIVLGAAPTAECQYVVSYINVDKSGSRTDHSADGVTNGTTAVTAIAAPQAGSRRYVMSLSVFNPTGGTTDIGVIVRLNNNGTARGIASGSLKVSPTAPNAIYYENGYGWSKPTL